MACGVRFVVRQQMTAGCLCPEAPGRRQPVTYIGTTKDLRLIRARRRSHAGRAWVERSRLLDDAGRCFVSDTDPPGETYAPPSSTPAPTPRRLDRKPALPRGRFDREQARAA